MASVSAVEVERFGALAGRWWDPAGPMAPLHAMNPARVGWVQARLLARFGDVAVRLLDVGCGAGLAAELLARSGHSVLGLDAAPALIEAARAHAAGRNLPLEYRCGTAEALVAEGLRFPAITALEVIEHVPHPGSFLRLLAGLLEPGGLLVLSTLNRTPASWITAKMGAEYLLRMLPVGTHDWRKFITPAELGALARDAGLRVASVAGLNFSPVTGQWRAGGNLSVNYIIAMTT